MKGITKEDGSQFILDVLEENPQNVSGSRTEYRVETENSQYTVAEEKVNNHSIISVRQNDRLVSIGTFSIPDDQTGDFEVAEIGESYVAEEIEDMNYADPISFMSGETGAEINKTSLRSSDEPHSNAFTNEELDSLSTSSSEDQTINKGSNQFSGLNDYWED